MALVRLTEVKVEGAPPMQLIGMLSSARKPEEYKISKIMHWMGGTKGRIEKEERR